ncbi:response regulator [Psychromonas sp. L1A2]|uniref:response regulator n=1 Tax=Psychromonas sp. L1A2 TaxID=2686356 RepID=UPI001357D19F|nr:response regulator [Psychromonas sp. L1A2]
MSFRLKTMLMIGLTEALFLLLLLWQALAYIERSGEEALYSRASETSHLFSLLVKSSVISSDIASLDEITQQIVKLKDIRYIRVIDNIGVLAQAGDTSSLKNGFIEDTKVYQIDDGLFDAQVLVSVSGVEFAKVQVGLSVDSLLLFVTDARYRLIMIALAELLIVALVSLILSRYLTKGLLALQKVALAVTKGDMSSRATIISKDELGVTAGAFNVMLDKINCDQKKLNKNAIHLTKAKQIAEDASQAKSRFLSQMSHEIRSPMNAVLGAVNLVAEQIKEPPEYIRLLNTAKTSGNALLGVVNDILDFSKIEAGHMELKFSEVNLAELVEDVLNSVEAKTAKNELTLLGDVSPGVIGRVITDAIHFRQILNILVDNACKFTDKGVVMVSLSRVTSEDGDEMLHVSVKDSGMGIKQSSLTKIFDEFEQVDSTLEARTSGTGLGLNIAQGLINLMKGSIGVSSVLGEGSEFYFTLPVIFVDQAELKMPMLEGPMVLVSSNHSLRTIFTEKMSYMNVDYFEFDNISVLREQMDERFLSNTAIWLIDDNVLSNAEECHNDWVNSLNININCISSLGKELPLPYRDFNRINRPIFCHDICYLSSINKTNVSVKIKRVRSQNNQKNSILLVDDIEANRFIAGETLKNRGYKVCFACDGIEALEILEKQSFDVILMDVRMPRMNGIDAVRYLKSGESLNRHTPVIAMTANAEVSEMERCKAAGMDDFIGKPFDTQILVECINRCIYNTKIKMQSITETKAETKAETNIENNYDESNNNHATNNTNNGKDELTEEAFLSKEVLLSKESLKALVADTSPVAVLTLIGFFIDDINHRSELINQSLKSADLEGLGDHAHALKSSAGSLGAEAMFSFCKNLEQASLAKDLPKAEGICKQLNLIAERTLVVYKDFKNSQTDSA